MIDRERRNRYAEQLRHFAAGVSTVEDYEARTDGLRFGCGPDEDEAIYKVWRNVWPLYDDFCTERLRGEWEITKETRRWITISILFLYSDCEYQWPEFRPRVKDRFFGAMDDLVSGLLFLPDALTSESFQLQERWWNVTKSFRERQWEEGQRFYRQFGDMEIWPFLHQADYAAALKNPKFLAGA